VGSKTEGGEIRNTMFTNGGGKALRLPLLERGNRRHSEVEQSGGESEFHAFKNGRGEKT